MLAYVFWHVPRPGIAARDYEAAHREFHEVLWKSGVNSLVGVRIFKLDAIPWLGGMAGYEDWHLLEDSAGLDVLNAAAVSQVRQLPHDRIAAMAADGTAGLYAIRSGAMNEPARAYWLSKPAGMGYQDFEGSMKPHTDAGACLWGRRMTLGPTPEFCLQVSEGSKPAHPALEIAVRPLYAFK